MNVHSLAVLVPLLIAVVILLSFALLRAKVQHTRTATESDAERYAATVRRKHDAAQKILRLVALHAAVSRAAMAEARRQQPEKAGRRDTTTVIDAEYTVHQSGRNG